jgi:hypothetical protein
VLDCRGSYSSNVVFVYRPHLCALHLLPIRHTSLRRSSILVDLQIGNNLRLLVNRTVSVAKIYFHLFLEWELCYDVISGVNINNYFYFYFYF